MNEWSLSGYSGSMLRRSHLKVTLDQWVTKVLKQWPICGLCHRIAFIAHIVVGRLFGICSDFIGSRRISNSRCWMVVEDIPDRNSMWVTIADVCGFIFSSAVNVCDKVTDYFVDRTSFPQNSHALYLSPSLLNIVEESFDSDFTGLWGDGFAPVLSWSSSF